MSSRSVTEKLKQHPLAIICVIIAIGAFGFYMYRGDVLFVLEEKKNELTARTRVIDKNVSSAVGIESEVERVIELKEEYEQRLFDVEERAINTNFFYGFEDRVDVLISSVNQVSLEDPALSAGGPKELKLHAVIVYDITVEGSFTELTKLLYELYSAKPLIRVADFQFSSGGGAGSLQPTLTSKMRVLVMAEKVEKGKS